MKQLLSFAAFFAVLAFGAFAYAQGSASYEEIASNGPGVYRVKTDEETGELQSLLVVGSAPVSTVLGAARGKDLARRKALLVCDSEFAKWCSTNLEYTEDSEEGAIFSVKGSEDDEGDSLSEEGKSSEEQKRKISAFAKKAISGLQVVYTKMNADDKEFIVVKAFSMKSVKAVKEVNKALKSIDEDDAVRVPPRNSANGGANNQATPGKSTHKGTLKNESHMAPGADEFL